MRDFGREEQRTKEEFCLLCFVLAIFFFLSFLVALDEIQWLGGGKNLVERCKMRERENVFVILFLLVEVACKNG